MVFGVRKNLGFPHAHFAVITYTNDVVTVLRTDDRQRIDRMIVTILSETTLLYRLLSIPPFDHSTDRFLLGSNVPLKQVPCLGGSNDHVGIVRVEHGPRDFVLAFQLEFGLSLQGQTEQVDSAVFLVHAPLVALAVTRE